MSDRRDSTKRSNVFADLDLPDPEGALAKAELAFQINMAIEARGWDDTEAAAQLDLSSNEIAALTRGQLMGFSTDTLFQLLNALNIDVDINLEPNVSPDRPARVAVQGHATPIAAGEGSVRPDAVRFD